MCHVLNRYVLGLLNIIFNRRFSNDIDWLALLFCLSGRFLSSASGFLCFFLGNLAIQSIHLIHEADL